MILMYYDVEKTLFIPAVFQIFGVADADLRSPLLARSKVSFTSVEDSSTKESRLHTAFLHNGDMECPASPQTKLRSRTASKSSVAEHLPPVPLSADHSWRSHDDVQRASSPIANIRHSAAAVLPISELFLPVCLTSDYSSTEMEGTSLATSSHIVIKE